MIGSENLLMNVTETSNEHLNVTTFVCALIHMHMDCNQCIGILNAFSLIVF